MIAFVHISKTAGTTLHKIISHQSHRVLIHHDSNGPLDAALADRIQSVNPDAIMGHLSVGLHLMVPKLRYVTCLREPVSRVVSHYHHSLNDPSHYLHQKIVSGNLDLQSYVTAGLSGELSNGMTRMLAGVEDFDHAVVDRRTLDIAKTNIETLFDGVILSEWFDPGILMLAAKLQWRAPYYIRRKIGSYGTASRKPDEATRKAIEKYNQIDIELYDWAKQRFKIQAAAFPQLAEHTDRFQKTNSSIGKAIFCLRELRMRIRGGIR
jgi:hypothetical protein